MDGRRAVGLLLLFREASAAAEALARQGCFLQEREARLAGIYQGRNFGGGCLKNDDL
jgi:hypothetical protein